MSKFGWSLPPGCSNRDIERSQGADYDSGNYSELCGYVLVCDRCGKDFAKREDAAEHQANWIKSKGCTEVTFRLSDTYCKSCGEWIFVGPQDHEDEEHREYGATGERIKNYNEDEGEER